MTDRRGFFSWLTGGLAALFVAPKVDACESLTVSIDKTTVEFAIQDAIAERNASLKFCRVFRNEGSGRWMEIKWEDMKAGDEIVRMDDQAGRPISLRRFTIAKMEDQPSQPFLVARLTDDNPIGIDLLAPKAFSGECGPFTPNEIRGYYGLPKIESGDPYWNTPLRSGHGSISYVPLE